MNWEITVLRTGVLPSEPLPSTPSIPMAPVPQGLCMPPPPGSLPREQCPSPLWTLSGSQGHFRTILIIISGPGISGLPETQ